jgi:transcription elongation factor GreA
MTAEGLEALRAEIAELEGPGREEIAKQIKTAREWGDLKENAEYHAAKDAQAHLETRILVLRDQLQNAKVVEAEEGAETVVFGSKVELEDQATGRTLRYELVNGRDASPPDGRLAFDSPVGTALRDRRVGDVAVVQTPRGERRLRVVSIG